MADDIDIEEHDVLENLRTRGMLSDLDLVKTEPDEYVEEDEALKEPEDSNYQNYYEEEEEENMEEDNFESDPTSPNEYPQFNNKIILGTKLSSVQPSPTNTDDDKVFNSFVYLKEWGDILYSSKCYCRDCEILFPTRNALDAHNTVAHSFLVARPSLNIAIKSTAKPQTANVARKSTTTAPRAFLVAPVPSAKKSSDPAKFCNHCKLTFTNNTALIKHLYEHLPATVQECNVCNEVFETAQELDEHKKKHSTKLKSKEMFMCPVCLTFFNFSKWYFKHCKNNHGRILEPRKVSEFNGKCPFCPCVSRTVRCFQNHAASKHADQYYKGVNTSSVVKPAKGKDMRYYVCKICSCHYTLMNSYRRHLETSHSTSPVKPHIRENFNPKCKFCTNTFENSTLYNVHIRNEHMDSFKKIGTNKNIPIQQQNNVIKTKYRCRVCNEIVIGRHAAIVHREKHPDSKKNRFMTKSLTTSTKNQMVSSEKVPLVPKGVLFKCDKCPVHFFTAHIAESHRNRGCSNLSLWKCPICKRQFKPNYQTVHLAQHKADEKLKVYTIRPRLYKTVLCHCFKCKICYDEYSFLREHSYGTCENNVSVYCKLCKRNIYGGCYKRHLEMHKEINKNDFITIDFAPQNCDSLKRKLTENLSTYGCSKKMRSSFNHYYYCEFCKSYFIDSTHIQSHLHESCNGVKKKSICNLCGLVLPTTLMYRHRAKHEDPQFDPIKHATFFSIQTMKEINPPIPEFFLCNVCSVHHLSLGALHKCSEKQVVCNLCNRKYNEYAFKLHNKYHRELDSINSGEASNLSDDIPALLKKYHSIQPLWNILYQCESCDVVTDTYDQVIEHCQMHFNDMEKCDVFRCDDCQLTFHSTCYARHCQLHVDNRPMNRDSFRIIGYDYTQLAYLDVWLKKNRSLTAQQMSQITSRSIYRYSRCIKFDVIQKSDPECTLYKCGTCLNCVDPREVIKHVKQKACSNKTTSKCSHCSLNFICDEVRNQHENQHGSVLEFGMIIFNSEKDKPFNKRIHVNAEELGVADDSAAVFQFKGLARSEKNRSVITLFKCIRCKICVSSKDSARKHKCSSSFSKCRICNNKVSNYRLKKHLDLHKNNPKLNYVLFNPRSRIGKFENTRNVRLYKCSCGLHFMSDSSIQKHYQECGDDGISREKCSKCDLLFPTNVLVNHLCNHHTDECKIDVIDSPNPSTHKKRIVLYKCKKCNLHYNSSKSLSYHFDSNHAVKHRLDRCNICNIKFPRKSAIGHMRLHKRMTFNVSDIQFRTQSGKNTPFYVDTESNNPKTASANSSEETLCKVYKCSSCPAHFISYKSYRNHYKKQTHCEKEDLTKCKVCGIRFLYYDKHYALHHEQMGLKLHQIKVVVQSSELKKYSKFEAVKTEDLSSISESSSNENGDEEIKPNAAKVKKTLKRKYKNLATSYENDDDDWKRYVKTDKTKLVRKSRNSQRDSNQDSRLSQDSPMVGTDDDHANTKVTLHKCSLCNCHFVRKAGLISHIARDKHLHEIEGADCEYCGFFFTRKTLALHVDMHHKNGKLKHIDISVMKYGEKNAEETESQSKEANGLELFKCEFCNLHFMSARSHKCHVRAKTHLESDGVKCEDCGLVFAKVAIDHHKMLHHKSGNNIDPSQFHINYGYSNVVPFDGGTAIIYKCSLCSCHFIEKDYFKTHMEVGNHIDENDRETCKECGLHFSKGTISNHYYNHHEINNLKLENFKIIDKIEPEEAKDESIDAKHDVSQSSNADNSLNASNTEPTTNTNKTVKKYNVKLYKCGECNVYFITQSACYKHASKHVPIDPMEYIECKICSLQFNYTTLHIHMKNHHFKQKFDLEDLLVEEYKPASSGVPKIDIYCALDRVQSRLVSTTTDDSQEPSSSKDVAESSNSSVKESNPENEDITDTVDISDTVDASKEESVNVDNPMNDQIEVIDLNVNDNTESANGTEGTHLSCKFCGQTFKSRSSLGLHESLEHMDAMKKCPICKSTFNESILNEIHLGVDKKKFKCCLCSEELDIDVLETHSCSVSSHSSDPVKTQKL